MKKTKKKVKKKKSQKTVGSDYLVGGPAQYLMPAEMMIIVFLMGGARKMPFVHRFCGNQFSRSKHVFFVPFL